MNNFAPDYIHLTQLNFQIGNLIRFEIQGNWIRLKKNQILYVSLMLLLDISWEIGNSGHWSIFASEVLIVNRIE